MIAALLAQAGPTPLAELVIVLYPVVCGLVFFFFGSKAREKAVAGAMVGGFLFLPRDAASVFAIPWIHSKHAIVILPILVLSLVLDRPRWRNLKLDWADLPVIAFGLTPLAASLDNGLGLYNGLNAMFVAEFPWAFSYLVGRLYFTDLNRARTLAVAITAGGLVYAPFCLWEIRMSPMLQWTLYGFAGADFTQVVRFGGYRPQVFLDHGLMVSFWIGMAAVTAWWMHLSGSVTKVLWLPARAAAWGLLATEVLCKSTGAIALTFLGIALPVLARRTRLASWMLVAMMASVPGYCLLRLNGWDGRVLTLTTGAVDAERAQSLEFRMINEDKLIEKALQRPLIGWGGWGRSRVYDEDGKNTTTTDGLWIIIVGEMGLVGLTLLILSLLLPVCQLLLAFGLRGLLHPALAPAGAFAITLVLFAIDCIPNAMVNPIYMVAAGCVSNIALSARGMTAAQPARPRHRALAGSRSRA